jgi:nickel-dependent lactate racemase
MPRERSVSIDGELDLMLAGLLLKERPAVATDRAKNSVDLRWKAWYGEETITLGFPDEWNVRTIPMKDAPTLTDAEIRERILSPIGSPRLRDVARGRKRAAIAIDDLDRPTEGSRILPHVLDELHAAGLKDDDIIIVASLGSHRPMTRQDFVKKVGEDIVSRIKTYNHNAYENLQYAGTTSYGTPLHINKFFMEADLKIGLGHLSPHPFAGFSGGGKIVLPGLAGIETIELNHKPTNAALSGRIGQVGGNTRRAEMDEAGRMAGLEFVVNAVSNSYGKTAGLFAGEISAVFQAAAGFAGEVYATDVPYGLDIGVFNVFPKDTHLLQALNALNIWSTRDPDRAIVRKGGAIVITTACNEGPGYHSLSDKGMRLHTRRDKHGTFKDILEGRKLIFFSPNLISADIYDHYPPEVLLFQRWEDVVAELRKHYGGGSSVGVFPSAPLQMDKRAR